MQSEDLIAQEAFVERDGVASRFGIPGPVAKGEERRRRGRSRQGARLGETEEVVRRKQGVRVGAADPFRVEVSQRPVASATSAPIFRARPTPCLSGRKRPGVARLTMRRQSAGSGSTSLPFVATGTGVGSIDAPRKRRVSELAA